MFSSACRSTSTRALQMVAVDVSKEQVAVEQARVEVERQALENKQTYSEAALRFELDKLQIEAGRDVQRAMAESIGSFMSRGQFTIYGDPTTMSQMMRQYTQGLSMGSLMNGLVGGTGDGAKAVLGDISREVSAIVERFTGKTISLEQAGEIAARFATDNRATTETVAALPPAPGSSSSNGQTAASPTASAG